MKDFVAFFVCKEGRHAVHCEIFEATDLSTEDLTERIITHTRTLEVSFPLAEYDVSFECYNTFDAMQRKNPELALDSSQLIPWI
jgi:hypothetical protein